jgi:hypothetical protein
MNLVQKQIQSQELPESLENLFTEIIVLYLDYQRDKTTIILEDLELLEGYEGFPEVIGRVFLGVFRRMVEVG